MTTSAPALYRGFTRADLDREYAPSSMVESIAPFLARYAQTSAAARDAHDPRRLLTVAHGPAPSQTFDLFQPTADLPAACLLFIHGGYWRALSKLDASFPAPAITAAGHAYAALDYSLAPHATLDAIVEECRTAVTTLWSKRAALGVASNGLVIAGHSAGAQLTGMVLATDWPARGVDPRFIQGAVLIGGVYDLEPIRHCYVNDPLQLDAAAAHRNSPMFQSPTVRVPLIVTWGEHETAEFKRQSRTFATAWGDQCTSLTPFELPERNHFDALFDWCDPTRRLHQETLRLLAGRPTP